MGGGYGGAYGQQSGPSYGGYQQGYQQNGYSNGDFGDFGFGYDPFGFGFGFGGNYQQQRGPGYNGADTPEMQAARNFIVNQRYPEARRVLDGITVRTARWYYLSSLANQGLGNSIDALQDARRAAHDPAQPAVQLLLWRRLGLAVPDVSANHNVRTNKNLPAGVAGRFFAHSVIGSRSSG